MDEPRNIIKTINKIKLLKAIYYYIFKHNIIQSIKYEKSEKSYKRIILREIEPKNLYTNNL